MNLLGDLIGDEIQKGRNTLIVTEDEEIPEIANDPDDIWHFIDNSVRNTRNSAYVDDGRGIPTQLRQYLSAATVNRKANPNPFATWAVIETEYPYVDQWLVR